MIADDSEAIRFVLKDIIKIGKHDLVAEATNGQETIEKWFKTNPDILLLDLAMPKVNGLQVIKEIISKNPSAKIVIISASGSDKLMTQCLKEGAIDYIAKPFDADKILNTISSLSNT